MTVMDILEKVQKHAYHDEDVMEQLLETENSEEPVAAFCEICRNLGYELYEMELISAGEEFHAAMKRSTNGGGENSPLLKGEDDFYELFIASLKEYKK